MPCEKEAAAIETELFSLAREHGARISGPHWTHKPGGTFRLTVTTGNGDQVLEFPLPEVAEYFHTHQSSREAVRTRLREFVARLPVSATPPAAAPAQSAGDESPADQTEEILREALARIKAIELVLVKKGLTTKDELATIRELLLRPASTR